MFTDTRELFERHQLRCTKQRIDLYEALATCHCHPTAEQLHRMVCERAPGTSLATVYNTLDAFTKSGLCRRIATSGGGARFDADLSHHLHVTMPDGRLLDVPHEMGEEILNLIPSSAIERLEDQLGIKVQHMDIQLQATSAVAV